MRRTSPPSRLKLEMRSEIVRRITAKTGTVWTTARGRRLLTVLTVVLAGTFALACQIPTLSSAGAGQPRRGGALVVASWLEPNSMLAAGITDTAPHAIAVESPISEGLVGRSPGRGTASGGKLSDRYQPVLAREVPTVENGGVKVSGSTMAVTYKLRAGVKWHDGKPFSSQDVVDTASFYYLKYREANPTPLLSTAGWEQIASVEAPDPLTAVVNFKTVYGPYLSLFSGPFGVLPSHLLQPTWAAGGDLTKAKLAVDLTPANAAA